MINGKKVIYDYILERNGTSNSSEQLPIGGTTKQVEH